MSRHGFGDDGPESQEEQWAYICYRGAVTSAIRGKKGQTFLKEMLAALDAMPVKELIAEELVQEGSFCALGVVGHKRGLDLEDIDPEDIESCAGAFGINEKLCREIVYVNDKGVWWNATPRRRYEEVRGWLLENIKDPYSEPAKATN
jgi:hypothetical protein